MSHRRFKIVAIVEGHGDQHAVPVLLGRWFHHRRYRNFDTPDLAVRAAGVGALLADFDEDAHRGVEHYVRIALAFGPDAILVVLDADDECLARDGQPVDEHLGPVLLRRARSAAPHVPTGVVVANREYEAWFLAGLDRLRRVGLIPCGGVPRNVESIRDCKGRLQAFLGRRYEETVDQARLTAGLPFTAAMRRRSRSFGKLLRELEGLAKAARRARTGP